MTIIQQFSFTAAVAAMALSTGCASLSSISAEQTMASCQQFTAPDYQLSCLAAVNVSGSTRIEVQAKKADIAANHLPDKFAEEGLALYDLIKDQPLHNRSPKTNLLAALGAYVSGVPLDNSAIGLNAMQAVQRGCTKASIQSLSTRVMSSAERIKEEFPKNLSNACYSYLSGDPHQANRYLDDATYLAKMDRSEALMSKWLNAGYSNSSNSGWKYFQHQWQNGVYQKNH